MTYIFVAITLSVVLFYVYKLTNLWNKIQEDTVSLKTQLRVTEHECSNLARDIHTLTVFVHEEQERIAKLRAELLEPMRPADPFVMSTATLAPFSQHELSGLQAKL